MSYSAPVITNSGLLIPTYSEILEKLLEDYRTVYGQDVYLGEDSADYQWISIVSLALSDVMEGIQYDYNNKSPWTAIGAALDTIVKINGLTRKAATYSSCVVIVSGDAGTVITNGICEDTSGYKWDLPATTTIGNDGTVSVTATCETIGAIPALAGNINKIFTPQAGWSSVTNAVAAVQGQPVETDAQLRARQALSTKMASHTMLSGTVAAIAAVDGVTRYNVEENYTDAIDWMGNPPHSITPVVEGGTDSDVAEAIFYNRGIGCDTNGTTTVSVQDPDTLELVDINFYRPSYIPIYVTININPFTGYTTATRDAIEEAIYTYLNSLQIGEDLTVSALYGIALSVMEDLTKPIFSITSLYADTESDPTSTDDITIAFNEVTEGIIDSSPEYIIINDGLSP